MRLFVITFGFFLSFFATNVFSQGGPIFGGPEPVTLQLRNGQRCVGTGSKMAGYDDAESAKKDCEIFCSNYNHTHCTILPIREPGKIDWQFMCVACSIVPNNDA